MRLFRRRPRPPEPPPVAVPAGAIRPGEDDRALVGALVRYLRTMRENGGWAMPELDPEAVAAGDTDAYLAAVEEGGHALYLASRPSEDALVRAQAALAMLSPALAELHDVAAALAAEPEPDAEPDPETLAELDAAFWESGGRSAADPALAGMVAAIETLEIVPDRDYPARIAALAASHPEAANRLPDLRVAALARRLERPLEAGVAIVLARAAGSYPAFRLDPGGSCARDDGRTVTDWRLDGAGRPYRALALSDRIAVFAEHAGGREGLGHIGRDKLALAAAWAREGHAALAARLALDELGAGRALRSIVFDSRKQLKKSGAEAAAFHLGMEGTGDLALVVFPRVTALVDPATNERLVQIPRTDLAAEAAALDRRLAALDRGPA